MMTGRVPRGYKLDRDDNNLTARERQAYKLAADGKSLTQIADTLGVTKGRAGHIVRAVIRKGYLVRDAEGAIYTTNKPLKHGDDDA